MGKLYAMICILTTISVIATCLKIGYVASENEIPMKSKSNICATLLTIGLIIFTPLVNIFFLIVYLYILIGVSNEEIKEVLLNIK